jgi:clan AA aspartic protease
MIEGKVEVIRREGPVAYLAPRVPVAVLGSNGISLTAIATVDTGFTGWLTLPIDIIRRLGLTRYGQRPATQADGTVGIFDVYGAQVSWHEDQRPALVHQTASEPLVGMALLQGNWLRVDVREGGTVLIEESDTP